MPCILALLFLIALLSPAFAQDGPHRAADAKEAVQALQLYLDAVTKSGGRPDYAKPPASELLHRVFDVDGLAALPPPQSSDVMWLAAWVGAANQASKSIMMFGLGPELDANQSAVLRNLKDHEDQYANALTFQIRASAREGTAVQRFMDQLTPDQRTPVREAGLRKARRGAGELVSSAIGSVLQGMKPENARKVTEALRDTGAVWATFMLPEDRASLMEKLAATSTTVGDGEAQNSLAALAEALKAAK